MSSSTAPPLRHPMHLMDAQSIVLDLSHLNGAIHREPPTYLVPEPLLPALAAFRYFTTLDFDAGHLQIPLEPDSQRYFAFATPFGPFQLQRAPKHFANTTIVFNKILIELARKLPTGDVVVLNDTLVLPSRDTAEGLPQLARVLSALAAFGLTAILRRCRFFEAQIQLHNWIVQQGKVSSIGLPFRLPVAAGYRLVLVISESSTGKTFESLLRKENGTSEVIGRFAELRRQHDGDDDKTCTRLAKHVTESIEHFRQFLLFVSFEVLVDVSIKLEKDFRRELLQVQQFEFEIKGKDACIP
uniref:Reverse transcriptase domain-containing protein n=1 Tax=Anopheles melas TaxID=34690 RepID=A0A182TM13_9DIPT